MAEGLRLLLECDHPDAQGSVDVHLTVLNPSAEPVVIDRRLLYGPHPGAGELVLLASEPAAPKKSQNLILLNPSCFYGRARRYQYGGGEVTFHGYLLRKQADGLLPSGPTDSSALLAAAPPLTVDFGAPSLG